MNQQYLFSLCENTEFLGYFQQNVIKIIPRSMNTASIDLATHDISRIQRCDDPGWLSQKLRYFIFELKDKTRIAGIPMKGTCVVRTSFDNCCKIDFHKMVTVEAVV